MGFEEMLMERLGGGREREEIHLSGDAAQAWREKFAPIPNLKPGDKVRWKSGCLDRKHGDYGDVLEVFDVIDPPIVNGGDNGSNHQLDRLDFSMADWVDNKTFYIYAFDSRRFERVE